MKKVNNDKNAPVMAATERLKNKRYSPPILNEYGKVASLTKGGGPSARSDSGMNNMWP